MAIIVKQYEEHNMGVEDICGENGELEPTSVKAVLVQYSAKYRADIKDGQLAPEDDFSEDEAVMARQAIAQVMMTTDDDYLKLRAAQYIRNDKKGRLDSVNGLKNLNINVMAFNENMRKVQEARERTLKMVENKTIEVETTK